MKYLNFFLGGLLLGGIGVWQSAISTEITLAQANATPGFNFKNFDFWVNQCLQLSDNQNPTETLTACERAITLQPNRANAQLWLARSQALLQTGKYSEALASYDQVLKVEPKSSFAVFSQCTVLVQLERYDDAIDQCDRALQLDGDWEKTSPALAWVYRGVALRRQGYLETALASFDRALFIQPDAPLAQAEHCLLTLELTPATTSPGNCDRIEKALPRFEQALVMVPESALIWLEQGMALEQLGRYEQALTAYNQAVQLSHNQPLPLARRCGVLNQVEDYKTALESCNQALAGIRPNQKWQLAYLWTQHSNALLGLGKFDEAIAAADRAIAIQPADAITAAAETNSTATRSTPMCKPTEPASTAILPSQPEPQVPLPAPSYAPALNIKALAYWQQANYAQAAQTIQQADAAYQTIVNHLCQNTFYRGYPDPLATVRRGQMVVAFNQGRILSSLAAQESQPSAQYTQARKAYEKSLALRQQIPTFSEQDSSRDRRLLVSIHTNLSATYLKLGSYEEALGQAQQSLKKDPNSFAANYNQALSYDKLRYCKFALAAYRKANTIVPHNLYALLGEAQVLERLDQLQEAIAVYEKILQVDPTAKLAKDRYLELNREVLTRPVKLPSNSKFRRILRHFSDHLDCEELVIPLGAKLSESSNLEFGIAASHRYKLIQNHPFASLQHKDECL